MLRITRVGRVAGVVAALGTLGGCASQSKERLKVLEAENVDLRQHATTLEGQVRDAQAAQDRALAEVQRTEEEKAALQAQAVASVQARELLAQKEADLAAAQARLEAANRELAARSRPETTVAATTGALDPQLESLRKELMVRLERFHVTGVDVDVRTAQDGTRNVAVVLQNSFRAGGSTLSYNASAVKAVVGLGKLIAESYPGARVSVEGHTDADPIRKSKWESNEALSLARAEEVKRILVQAGVSEGQVAAVGQGARRPVSRGATDRAKAQNRRVEIYIHTDGPR